ncbi:unnamed protein product [Chironomus riparius]|uniref:CN hydrolase domain-containing protein n=1 Tax=Chironomus riparius TaxID=315576 RepID=A0A9N9RWX6_9DIPT|nr:unnamed protein product [Chironomus riparius]
MKKVWINFVGILTCWEYVCANLKDDFYIAAVVEFPLPTTPNSIVTNANDMIEDTLNEYLRLIDEAAENKADILTFPEGCLNYVGIGTRKLLIKYAVELNNDDIYNSTTFSNNCDYSKKSAIISKVSLKSRKNGIYVLINVIERVKSTTVTKNKYNLYSTNIVFDRNGCIVSRYRKFNTKLDPLLNKTEIAEVQVFHTDFGVTFGQFTSLDLMSKYPAYILIQYGIKHILHPTLWYSSTPFYTSLQMQQSYSYSNNIVLLAAGSNNLASGQGGSGIFVGRNGPLIMFQPGEKIKQAIISKVPKDHDMYSIQVDNNNVVKRYNLKEMDQFFISMVPLQYTEALVNQEFRKVCRNKLCCEIFVKYTIYDIPSSKFGYTYRFTAHSGVKEDYKDEVYDDEKLSFHEMHCSIVACTKATTENCGSRFFPSDNVVPSVKFSEIRINMIIELDDVGAEDLEVMPTNVDFRLLPLRVDMFTYSESEIFNENNKQYRKYTTTLASDTDTILTFGVLGRAFRLTEFYMTDDNSEQAQFWWYLLSSMTFGLVFMFIIWRLCKIK